MDNLNQHLLEEMCKLQSSEERFKTLLETIPDIVYRLDVDGYFTYISDAVRTLGYEPKELIGKHFSTIIRPDEVELVSRKEVLQKYANKMVSPRNVPKLFDERRAGKRGTTALDVHILKKKVNDTPVEIDKDTVIVEVNSSGIYEFDCSNMKKEYAGSVGIIKAKNERFTGTSGVIRDITERKKAEEELLKTKDFLQKVIDNTTNAIFTIDLRGRFTSVNRKVHEITGYTDSELIDQPFSILHRADSCTIANEQFMKVAVYGETISQSELELKRKDKSTRIVNFSLAPIYNEGQIEAIIGTAEDITHRKHIENQLRESKEQLQAIIDNSIAVIFLKDIEGRYLFINRQYEDILKITRQYIVGKTGYDIFPAEIADCLSKNDKMVLTNLKPLSFEEVVPHEDGLHTYVSIKFPLFDSQGNPYGVCGIATDITDRKRAEEELMEKTNQLEEMTRDLEKRVKDETIKRTQKEQLLIQQSKMAAMGEMINSIAHQWKQPLNAIALSSQDLDDAYLHGELNKEYINKTINTILQQINFMTKTIDDFRGFFKPSKAKVTLNIKSVIEETITMFAPLFAKDSVAIKLKCTEEDLLVTGYPNEFKQVVLNLINNSRDAILSRRETELTEVRGYDKIDIVIFKDDGKMVVSIRDNGGGIPDAIIERIFEPYFTTKPSDKGTGIGLYMSKTIVENNMGWSLKARNIEGGAEFRIEI
ncbi:MAG: PAS domain S-box protein [Nitrospirae bacterium]|nr:PAS domain S-box protein [Nitrospirota bacterium]